MNSAHSENVVAFSPAVRAGGDGVREAMERYDRRLRAYFLRLMTPADAADAVQDVYARLASAAKDDRDRRFSAAYVFRTADSVARDAWRRSRTRGGEHAELTENEASDTPTPFEEVRWRENARSLQAALAALPPRRRKVLMLHRIEGLSLIAISRRTGWPLRTVQRHLAEALAACRASLEAQGWFDE